MVVDGPKGFPEAINALFPETDVQTCIVHKNQMTLTPLNSTCQRHKAILEQGKG